MGKGRLEAFTDGVVAIIITIMVLELKVPSGRDWAALAESLPVFLAYVLSYVNVGLYWNNHHHLLHAAKRVNGRVLWANLALLFWLSLVPFVIRWIDEAGITTPPVAAYGVVLTMAAVSYFWLQWSIVACNGPDEACGLPSAATERGERRSGSTPPPSRCLSCCLGWPWRSMWRSRLYGWCRIGGSSDGSQPEVQCDAHWMRIACTLRFRARPASVLLSATGSSKPLPSMARLLGAMPWSRSQSMTDCARLRDRSRL